MSVNLETAHEAISQFEKVQSCKIVFDQLEMGVDKDSILNVLSDIERRANIINLDN